MHRLLQSKWRENVRKFQMFGRSKISTEVRSLISVISLCLMGFQRSDPVEEPSGTRREERNLCMHVARPDMQSVQQEVGD